MHEGHVYLQAAKWLQNGIVWRCLQETFMTRCFMGCQPDSVLQSTEVIVNAKRYYIVLEYGSPYE